MSQTDDNIILPYKDRVLNKDQPIRVYRNLTKKGVWYSLVQKGKTVAHSSAICLRDCTFHVNEKGRQRVIKNKRKEFHAYILGMYTGSGMDTTTKRNDLSAIIKYNPYKHSGFTCTNLTINHFVVKGAWFVICNEEGVKASYTF